MDKFCHLSLLVSAILAGSSSLYAAEQHDWENPRTIGINKESYHATLTLPSRILECKEVSCLDGTWKFNWAKDPDNVVKDFYVKDFDASAWNDIIVPGEWQLQGYGKPIYSNMNYPFKANAPYVMDEPRRDYYSYEHRNPVGQYITTFEIEPEDLNGKALYLHFGGVESAFYLWINGQMVGYSQNSMAPAEFNITGYVVEGTNRLAVQVYQWSDGSYLEDQDMWRLSGIFRSVYLWKRPAVHIADYNITTSLDTVANQATVGLKVVLRNTLAKNVSKLAVSATVANCNKPSDKIVSMKMQLKKLAAGAADTLYLSGVISDPLLWSPEKPNLYNLELKLSGKDVSSNEEFVTRFGVRTVEQRGEVFYFNGKPVKMKGVNRHESHPRLGRTPDENTYRIDLSLMKQANINMIRTSHYPSDPLFYELCDEYGFYVMDEANQETHQYGIGNTFLGDNPDWTDAHVDRALALVKRDFNHPCVIIWSLGNEGGSGRNFKAMADAIRSIDPTRLVFSDSDRSVSDWYDDSYLSPERAAQTAARVTDRPFFMREYYYQEGNSGGNLDEYWQYIDKDPSYLGGAIWEWASHGLAARKDGSALKWGSNRTGLALDPDEYFAFGGDFGDTPNDGTDCINGLVNPDRTVKPSYYQVQYVYQNLQFEYLGNNKVKVVNKNFFTGANEYDYEYEYVRNGKPMNRYKATLSDAQELTLRNIPNVDGEILLNVYAKLREPVVKCLENQIVAKEQFVVKERKTASLTAWKTAPELVTHKDEFVVTMTPNRFVIDRQTAKITSWQIHGQEVLRGPVEPYFWKPVTDVQAANGYLQRMSAWRPENLSWNVIGCGIRMSDNVITLKYTLELSVQAKCVISYSFNLESVQVSMEYIPSAESANQSLLMPKFGTRMQLDNRFDQVIWYGRGPAENYPDRKSGYFIGEYSCSVNDFVTDYVHPQDNANRTDVRNFTLRYNNKSEKNNCDIAVQGVDPLCIRIWPYSEQQLENARHPYQIEMQDYVNVNIDMNIHGVGGNDGWGSKTSPEYSIKAVPDTPYKYSFIMSYRELPE